MKTTGKKIRRQAIELLKQSDQLSAEQIARRVSGNTAKVTRVLLGVPEIHFNGFMFEYLEPDDPRRNVLSVKAALDSCKWQPTLFGQRIMHSWVEIVFLEQILNHYKFMNLIELGTASGGLTTLFMLHGMKTNSHILSIDIEKEPDTEPYTTLATASTYRFIKGDAIHPTQDNNRIIKSAIQRDGKTLLYCDANGYDTARKDQMTHWVPHMKHGDVVITHDYPISITEAQIQPLIKKYNLTPFHQKEAWRMGCRMLTYEKQ